MRRYILALITAVACVIPALASAQAVIVPSPVPALTNNCTLKWQTSTSTWICSEASAASQPLTDTLALMADGTDATKILALQLSGITTGTTRTWTVPDANLTIPTTIASLGANTFTGLQTLNGGLAATTGTFSSTLGVTGDFAVATNKFTVASATGNTMVNGTLTSQTAFVTGGTSVGYRYQGTNGYYSFITRTGGGSNTWTLSLLGTGTTAATDAIGSDIFSVNYQGNTTIAGTLQSAGLVTASAGVYVSGGTIGNGRMAFDSTFGLTLYGKAGSSDDLTLLSASGNYLLRNPTGTNNLVLVPSGTLTVSGNTSIAGTLAATGGSSTAAGVTVNYWVNIAASGVADGSFVHGLSLAGWKSIGYASGELSVGGYVGSQWNTVALYASGTKALAVTSTSVALPATNKLYFDGGGDTYIYEPSSNTMMLHVGSVEGLYLTTTAIYAASAYSDTTADAANLTVAADGRIRRSTSSIRWKKDVNLIPPASAVSILAGLRPVTFRSQHKSDAQQRLFPGFIAEEVAAVAPILATYDADGQPDYVTYDRVPVYLVAGWQAHDARIAALEAEIAALKIRH